MFKLCRTICELNNNNVGYKTNINRPIYGYNSWDLIWDIDGSYIPSGYLTVRHGKSPFFIGKPSINGPFSMAMLVITRGYINTSNWNCTPKYPQGIPTPPSGDVKSWFNGPIEGKRRETRDFTIPILPPI